MLRSGQADARLEGSREELFAIVTDYEHYPSWVPSIESCHVLTREGDVAVAEIRASRWADRSFTLELIQSPPSAVEFRRIDNLDPLGLIGRWELGDTDPGVGGDSVRVRVRLRLDTPFASFGSRRRIREELRATLDALEARRRRLVSGRAAGAPTKRKILEVVREARGLKVWYMGQTFVMPKTGEHREK